MSQHVHIAIIGTGFAGLGTAVRLKQEGIEDFVILERAADVGGTWRDNSYPGCRCDVPSHLYSFSFALNPEWTNTFSPQPEIWDYLRRVAHDHDLLPKIRFGHEVLEGRWDEDAARWELETAAGPMTADVVVAGAGGLADPAVPDIPGLDRFTGKAFHSARWDHDHDLTGERVAVIGTGASAIQFVPQIQPQVGELRLFQRTPPWIVPHPGREIGERRRRLYRRVPGLQRLVRAGIYWTRELLVVGLAFKPRLMKVPERLARMHLRKQVPDRELRRKLTPSYTIGCKRILQSNDYYPALAQPNVDVVTSGIAEVRERSIVTADGAEHEVDTIIFGTGFHVTDLPFAERVRGAGGVTLAEQWADEGMQAYMGTTVAGFPNLFILVGPNTGLGHTSIVFMIESQVNYVVGALRALQARGAAAVNVRPQAQAAYNEQIQRDLQRTVWNTGGCASWYLDKHGKNTTLWPSFTFTFRQRTRAFDPVAYDFLAAPARTGDEREPVAA
jgi:cation diffusion facilitator CzcD-associated flavoprotein CzcO